MDKLDPETIENQMEGQDIADLVGHPGWGRVKSLFEAKLMDLQSVLNIDAKDTEGVIIDIAARKSAIEILREWMNEVEGRAEQHESNKSLVSNADHVVRTE